MLFSRTLHLIRLSALVVFVGYAVASSVACDTTSETNSSDNPPGGGAQHAAGTITGGSTWGAGTHTVAGTIVFTSGTLTIQAGATVVMTAGQSSPTSLQFGKNAGLVVQGTAGNPVIFTSSSGTPSPGDWGDIDFQVGSLPSIIDNANIVYGGGSLGTASGAVLVETGATVLMTNTAVENSAGFGVLVSGDANINGFVGNTLAHNSSGPISLTANAVSGLGQGTYTPNDVEGIDVAVSQLSQNANWMDLGAPYVLEGLTVETLSGQAVLTVSPGVTFLMAKGSVLVVQKNAGLVLAGTQESPIIVTSVGSPAARGDWGDIEFYTNSLGSVNSINYADIQYGGGSDATGANAAAVWLENDAAASINNTTVTNSAGAGVAVEANATLNSFANNTLIRNAGYPMWVDVDDVRQLQNATNTYVPNDKTGVATTGTLLQTTTHWGNLGTNYYLTETVDVDAGLNGTMTTLTIDPGTQITLGSSVNLNISDKGQLLAMGSTGSIIQFNGQTAQPGDGTGWGNVHFIASVNNVMQNVSLRYGGGGGFGTLFIDGGAVSLQNISIPIVTGPAFGALLCHSGGYTNLGGNLAVTFGDPNSYCPP